MTKTAFAIGAHPDDIEFGCGGTLLAHAHRADNDYKFTDHNQTFHDPTDDVERTRENADFTQYGAFGQGEARGPVGLARASAGYVRRDGKPPNWFLVAAEAPPERRHEDAVDGDQRRQELGRDDGQEQGSRRPDRPERLLGAGHEVEDPVANRGDPGGGTGAVHRWQ